MVDDGRAREEPGRAHHGLPYVPALDGLRGLAVAAVLLFHAGIGWAKGGFLGVSLFFTLSGFLITSLVLVEHRSTDAVKLRAFWGRRIRRLLPASLLTLLLALVVTVVAVPIQQRLGAIGDIRAALLNVANWRFVLQGSSYADLDLVPSPVQHYWSLAIEEQFYVVFPVVAALALRWRAKGLAAVFAAVIAASVWAQLALSDPDRIYFGTDTRAAELAIGGLLAIALPRLTALRSWTQTHGDVAAVVGLVATTALWTLVDQQAAGLYEGGLAVVAVVSSLVILGAVTGHRVAGLLAFEPLVGLGKISYGVYLFHFPLFLLITEARMGLSGPALLGARLTATLALALASYHLLERPIRTGRALPGRRSIPALATAAAVLALVTLPAAQRVEHQRADAGLLAAGVDIVASVPVTAPSPPAAAVTDPAGAGAGSGRGVVATQAPVSTTRRVPDEPQPATPRIVVVGDSTAEANGAGLQAWGIRTGRLEVTTVSSSGCASLYGPRFKVREGYEFVPQHCDTLFTTAADQARAVGADAIVVFIGSSQLADWELAGMSGWHHIGEADVDDRYVTALQGAAHTLEQAGVPVLWADVPPADWDLDAFSETLGQQLPGAGPVTLNEPGRAERLNSLDATVLPPHTMVQRWDYAARLVGPDGTISRSTRPDGLHVSEEAMGSLADHGLVDALAEAYRSTVERKPAGMRVPRANAWLSSPG